MREIKFRAKIGNDLLHWSLEDMCGPHLFTMRCLICPWLLQGNTPDQYTGLKDKNGKEIYQDDIISDHVGVGVVEYVDDAAAFRVNYRDGKAKWFIDYSLRGEKESIEVIGNIHENPELLEG